MGTLKAVARDFISQLTTSAIAQELHRDALLTLEQLTTSITVLALHSSHHHDFRLNAANASALRRHEDTATYAEG